MENSKLETGMRLIDANNLLDFFSALEDAGADSLSFNDAAKFINEQPTRLSYEKFV